MQAEGAFHITFTSRRGSKSKIAQRAALQIQLIGTAKRIGVSIITSSRAMVRLAMPNPRFFFCNHKHVTICSTGA